jgi:diguanylate cyclase (GGDEF)-like protein
MIKPDNLEEARILIVDDCEDAATMLAELLTLRRYRTIHTTTDAATVCDLHTLNNYDLILLDMHMPGTSGMSVMQQLRKMFPDSFLPVIVITGNNDLRLAALEAGAYDFVTKPFDFEEIDVRIRNMLEVRLLYRFLDDQRRLQQNVALHDPLTGLANRRLALDRIAAAVEHARRQQSLMAVMYLDVDGFKLVNDQHGHGCGDALLKEIAARLAGRMREEDTVARIGGDEFVVVLPEIRDLAGASKAAREIIALFSRPMQCEGLSLRVSTSIGIAVHPLDADNPETLLQSADQALYAAKRAGKNRYCFADASASDAAQPGQDVCV